MAEKKTIAVIGATGSQGGGLVRAMLEDRSGEFHPRAITRDANSASARALAATGAEVVEATLGDPAALDRAFAGAYGAFCVTFSWAHFSPQRETAEGRAMAEAAARNGLRHVIWSTLEGTRRWVPLDDARMPTLMGHYKVPHFDGKAEADEAFPRLGVPVTFLLTSFYWDNLINFGMGPRRGPDGRLAFTLPMADRNLPEIAAEDIGRCAYGIFQRGAELTGKRVGIAGGHLTGGEMAQALSRTLGQEVVYNYVPPEIYRTFGFPGAEDITNMFQFKRDFNDDFCRARDVAFSRRLNPALQTFDAWLSRNASRIAIG